ncbi:hypothetical protein HDU76_000163 [Blyttiomyces sp. JEL0837]|nr:hypothetical protein HDU76_000163 [Blyttiomyces sp. JEL0837]
MIKRVMLLEEKDIVRVRRVIEEALEGGEVMERHEVSFAVDEQGENGGVAGIDKKSEAAALGRMKMRTLWNSSIKRRVLEKCGGDIALAAEPVDFVGFGDEEFVARSLDEEDLDLGGEYDEEFEDDYEWDDDYYGWDEEDRRGR